MSNIHMLALGRCQKFLTKKGTYAYTYSLSNLVAKRCYRMLSNIEKESRISTYTIMESYTKKRLLYYEMGGKSTSHSYIPPQPTKREDALVESESVSGEVYKIVLTARPDEFEKLPPKCSACGVVLQPKDEKRPGYIHHAIFLDKLKEGELHRLICMNCDLLRSQKTPVISGILRHDALDQLHHLRHRQAVILYIVDLFDIEGTMLNNILQLVGRGNPIILVGNKIDIFPEDDLMHGQQLKRMEDVLKDVAYRNGLDCKLADLCLISAHTGFGLKTLIQKLHKHREDYMDVYLVGCTNTGKSTLYNLIMNMLHVHEKTDLPAQAIEHHILGTTASFLRESVSTLKLNLLKKRLEKTPRVKREAFDFDEELLAELGIDEGDARFKPMGVLAKYKEKYRLPKLLDERKDDGQLEQLEIIDQDADENEGNNERATFIYDTPGVLNSTQIIQYLTPDEIASLAPKKWIIPITLRLTPGKSLFVGGLARLDYISMKKYLKQQVDSDGADQYGVVPGEVPPLEEKIYVTVMCSPRLLLHVTTTETADNKFKELFCDNFFKLPKGSPERFEQFPVLEKREYTIIGENMNINSCDLSVHGIGWLSIAAVQESRVSIALHTPKGEGQDLRLSPILPYTVRKKKTKNVMLEKGNWNKNMYGSGKERSPQLVKRLYNQNETVYLWKDELKSRMEEEIAIEKEFARLQRIENKQIGKKEKFVREKEEELRLMEENEH